MQQRGPLIFLTVLLAVLLPFLLQIAWPFLTPLILAAILATVITPIRNRLALRIHRPGLATLLVTLATVILLGVMLTFVGFAVTRELTNAYDELNRRSLEEGGWPALVSTTVDRVVDTLATRLPLNKEAIRGELLVQMKSITGYLLNKFGAAVGGVTSVLITSFLVTIFLYFLLRHGEDWVRWLAALIPLDPLITTNLFRTVHQSIVANVNGVLAVAAAQGLSLSIGFWFVGVRSPVLWGLLGALASVIPVVGAPLVWVPIVIAFVFVGSYWKALILGFWGALVVGSLDNIVRPLVVGVHGKQHFLLVGLTMIGGTYAFGAIGILLGPLLISLAFAVVEEIRKLISASAAAATHPTEEKAQSPASRFGD